MSSPCAGPPLCLVDRTAHSPERYRVRVRRPDEVDLVVLHQTGTRAPESFDAPGLDRVRAHALVLDGGEGRLLHHPLARLRYGSSAWNGRCVTIEVRANLPGRYTARGEPRWWRPDIAGADRIEDKVEQVHATRQLLRWLVEELPGLRYIGAHRQVEAGKGGCCGPDLWRELGEWAIRELGLRLVETHARGSDLPRSWRNAPSILEAAGAALCGPPATPTSVPSRPYNGPLEASPFGQGAVPGPTGAPPLAPVAHAGGPETSKTRTT
ncbi:peptidoglycan recognition protein family protein [Nannocystis punicea]|uniref:N-acetylmuramoyl-L-alanine amidase n=1 Tax=Nannocystis punicea TaxID=2995304 RepID=A0ABY7HDD1_9BACT|nr:hypothetical protein [Nannocystis poenicansa]WAS97201.1 hypothetical protein O0S08_13720 [Nannocystis poenicansa]